jgi:hypothetical protein
MRRAVIAIGTLSARAAALVMVVCLSAAGLLAQTVVKPPKNRSEKSTTNKVPRTRLYGESLKSTSGTCPL